jgi:hypothetical protein
MESIGQKNHEFREQVKKIVGKNPHSVLVTEKDVTAKVTLLGIVHHNELKALMELGEVNVARSGAAVGISIKRTL